MHLMRQFLKGLLLMALSLILSQCSGKESKDYVQEGIDQTNQENYEGARESFLKAIEMNPKNQKAYYGLGGIYNYEKKFDLAAEAFETSVRLDPTDYNAYYSLGFTYEMMGRKADAEEKYQKSRKLKKQMQALMEPKTESR